MPRASVRGIRKRGGALAVFASDVEGRSTQSESMVARKGCTAEAKT